MISPIQSQASMLQLMQQLQQAASSEQIQPAMIGQATEIAQPSMVENSTVSSDFRHLFESINKQQNLSSELMAAVDSGRSDDVVGAMITGQKADLSFSMLLHVRNKVLSGVDDIMRMSL